MTSLYSFVKMDGSRGWNRMFEAQAAGDAIKLAKMNEIASWYRTSNEMMGTVEYMIICSTE